MIPKSPLDKSMRILAMLFGCLHIYFVGLLMILSSYLKFDLENDFLMVEYMLTKSGHLVRNISMSCHMPPPKKHNKPSGNVD